MIYIVNPILFILASFIHFMVTAVTFYRHLLVLCLLGEIAIAVPRLLTNELNLPQTIINPDINFATILVVHAISDVTNGLKPYQENHFEMWPFGHLGLCSKTI